MKIETFVFNPVQENTYVVYDQTGACSIIDAGCFNEKEFNVLDQFINNNQLKPAKLINTHCHFDHILGIEKCREAYQIQWEAHQDDAFLIDAAPAQGAMFGMKVDQVKHAEVSLKENDMVTVGNMNFKVIHIPGHSPGSICLYNEKEKVVFTGDVLFRGSIGRTDLPKGDYQTLIDGIQSKLMVLPPDVVVYPGHGPATTIGDEKASNPFLQ